MDRLPALVEAISAWLSAETLVHLGVLLLGLVLGAAMRPPQARRKRPVLGREEEYWQDPLLDCSHCGPSMAEIQSLLGQVTSPGGIYNESSLS